MGKQMGIEIDQVIIKPDDTDVTQEEMDKFIDEFIEFVESKGYATGGGFRLVDVNE